MALARSLAFQLKARNEFLAGMCLDDPRWLMTLELFIAGEEGRTVSVTRLCAAAGAPSTTALRHIRFLEEKGIFERQPCPKDRRIAHLRLSDNARLQLGRYLISLSSGETARE